jgi:hypothetical protein
MAGGTVGNLELVKMNGLNTVSSPDPKGTAAGVDQPVKKVLDLKMVILVGAAIWFAVN